MRGDGAVQSVCLLRNFLDWFVGQKTEERKNVSGKEKLETFVSGTDVGQIQNIWALSFVYSF